MVALPALPRVNARRGDLKSVYSLVVPIFNEEALTPLPLRRLDDPLGRRVAAAEVIFIDDGSRDASPIVLEAKTQTDAHYRLLKLSRNLGHQIAITTGMVRAWGEAWRTTYRACAAGLNWELPSESRSARTRPEPRVEIAGKHGN